MVESRTTSRTGEDPISAPQLGIVVPVFNEGDTILRTLRELDLHCPVQARAYIVYDFPEDTTLAVLSEFESPKLHVTPVQNGYGKGALNAIRWGINCVQESAVLVVMADLSDDLSNLEAIWKQFEEGSDVVCGSRYMPGGAQRGAGWLKSSLSRLAGLSLHHLFGLPTHDATNSYKLYRRSLIDEIAIESQGGFELGLELVVKAWGRRKRISEVPTVWTEREAGASRFRLWAWLPHYLRWYLLGAAYGIRFRLQGSLFPKRVMAQPTLVTAYDLQGETVSQAASKAKASSDKSEQSWT